MNARVVPFVAHRTRIRLRELERVARHVNRFGQYVRPTAEEAKRLQAEQLEHQRRDRAWASRHGPVEGGGDVVGFHSLAMRNPNSLAIIIAIRDVSFRQKELTERCAMALAPVTT